MASARLSRRRLLLAGAGALTASREIALAQAFPSGPVRIVHGYEAGTNPDVVSRILAPALGERLGYPIIVEPRPGAGGRISTGYVATQRPDGHTLGMITAGDSVVAATDPKLPYDLMRDFAFVAGVIEFPFFFLVRPDSPFRALGDLIAEGKEKPGALTFGTPGVRTTQHLTGELLKTSVGLDILHVPFKGNAVGEVVSGRLDFIIVAPSVAVPLLAAGTLRALAVSGATRMSRQPEVPTVGEIVPGFEVVSWLGLVAPAQTPFALVERLSADVREALAREDVNARLHDLGTDVTRSSGAAFRARVEADIAKWRALTGRVKLDP